MGCWDVFCFLCGNTYHGANIHELLLENIDIYENNNENTKGIKYFKTNFKPIYDAYKKDQKLFEKKIKSLEKNTRWLYKCTFLCADNKIVHGCEEVECNGTFEDKNGNAYTNSTIYGIFDDNMYGIFVHTDCWKFIKNEYGLNLNYSHLPINIHDITNRKIFDFINYGQIEKYWEQDFDFIRMISDDTQELSESPLKNTTAAKNIKKIFTKLKIRTDAKRVGPVVSATFYKPNTYKMGANGNIWEIKANKWMEHKDTVKIKLSDSNKKLIKKIIFAGDYNDVPVFISDIKQDKIIVECNILTTKEYLLKKKIISM